MLLILLAYLKREKILICFINHFRAINSEMRKRNNARYRPDEKFDRPVRRFSFLKFAEFSISFLLPIFLFFSPSSLSFPSFYSFAFAFRTFHSLSVYCYRPCCISLNLQHFFLSRSLGLLRTKHLHRMADNCSGKKIRGLA